MKKKRFGILLLFIILLTGILFAQSDYRIHIRTNPNFVRVMIDSVYYGTTPVIVDHLKKGKHLILLMDKNYKDLSFTVELDSVDTYIERILSRLYSQVTFGLKPGRTKILLDGKPIHRLALSLKIPFGRHTLYLGRDAYYSQKIRIKVNKPFLNMGNIRLQPKSRTTAFWLSAAFPGIGQIYSDRTYTGLSLFFASMAGLAYSFYPQLGYYGAKHDYKTSREYFDIYAKPTIFHFNKYKRRMFDAYYNMRRKYYTRNLVLIGTAVIWLYNLWDVYYLFPKQDMELSGSQKGLTLKINF